MFDKRCRTGVEKGLRPVGTGLGKVGITANQLTATGVVISILAGLAVARGWLWAGAALLAASAIPDLLDGAVAKASGTSSPYSLRASLSMCHERGVEKGSSCLGGALQRWSGLSRM